MNFGAGLTEQESRDIQAKLFSMGYKWKMFNLTTWYAVGDLSTNDEDKLIYRATNLPVDTVLVDGEFRGVR